MFSLQKFNYSVLIFGAIFSLTFFNKIAILLIPFVFFYFYFVSNSVNHIRTTSFLVLYLFCTIYWFYNGLLFPNYVVSTFILFSVIAFLKIDSIVQYVKIEKVIKFVIILMSINSCIGLVQMAAFRNPDAFIGMFGRGGLQGHGLAIIYALLSVFIYYEKGIFSPKKRTTLLVLFALSFILCFYGSGLIYAALSMMCAFIFSKKINHFFAALIVIPIFFLLVFAFDENVFYYNLNVFFYFVEHVNFWAETGSTDNAPRRLILFFNYLELISKDFSFFFMGSGPGTFNSRVSFLLNGDYSSLAFLPVSIHENARDYVFPLWNTELISKGYQDGSMNQPFSSLVSVLSEYGFIFFCIISSIVIAKVRSISKYVKKELLVFYCVFWMFLFVFENIYEYCEIVFIYFIIFQFYKEKYLTLV